MSCDHNKPAMLLTLDKNMSKMTVPLVLLCMCFCIVNGGQVGRSGIEVSKLFASNDVGRVKETIRNVDGSGCGCKGYQCGCCAHLQLLKIGLNDTVCTNLTYLPDQYGASLTVSVDGKVYYNDTISAKSPPPICFGVPHLTQYAKLCLKLYDLSIAERRLSGCAEIVAKVSGLIMDTFKLGCFKIPPTPARLLYQPSRNIVKGAQFPMIEMMDRTGCGCSDVECGCCVDLKLKEIDLNDTVCTNVTYLPEEYGVSLTISIDGKIYFNKTISARNPPPLCVGIPHMKKLASVCVQLYDMDISNNTLTGCARLTAYLAGEVIEKIELGCFKFPPRHDLISGSRHVAGLEAMTQGRVSQSPGYKATGCGCLYYDCGCCMDIPTPDNKETVCANLTFKPVTSDVDLLLTVNQKTLVNKTIPVRNPPPVCFQLPRTSMLKGCVQLYKLDILDAKLTGCVKVMVEIDDIIVEKLELGCFKFPNKPTKYLSNQHTASNFKNWLKLSFKEAKRMQDVENLMSPSYLKL